MPKKSIFLKVRQLTQGTAFNFLTFLTDNLLYFQDYPGKKIKTARYFMQNQKFLSNPLLSWMILREIGKSVRYYSVLLRKKCYGNLNVKNH